jgi:hypothetical protein
MPKFNVVILDSLKNNPMKNKFTDLYQKFISEARKFDLYQKKFFKF